MSPLQIRMLLDIYTTPHASIYPDGFIPKTGNPYAEALDGFRDADLVQGNASDLSLTERGRAYVNALQSLPLPMAMWTIPGFPILTAKD